MTRTKPKPAELLAIHAAELGLTPTPEHRFAPPRRWRFDLAFPDHMLAVEIEGGAWTGGRHTRGAGFISDMEKYNAAVLRGWRLLRFTPSQVFDGTAKATLAEAL
jgi:very-short-patch-repair endonuclease